MFRKFFVLSVLAVLICFSNHSVLISHEKSDQAQVNFEDLPEDLKSLIKKNFYVDVLSSYNIVKADRNFKAFNKLQNLEATFTSEGARVEGTRAQNSWQLDLCLNKFGWVDAVKPVKAGTLASDKNRIEIDRGNIKEWFINDQRGLEQGFTIDQPPEGTGNQLALELSINLGWEALVSQDKRNITLTNASGQSVDYAGLIAEDAQGRALETWFSSRKEKNQLICEIRVDVADAQFPILIDPVINETAKFIANDGATLDLFGASIDISGDTVVVGANGDFDTGSAYIFVRTGTTWTQQAKLLASDGVAGDIFGHAVAISGETAIVGAPAADDSGLTSGSAYIFVRAGTTWTQQAKLLANDGTFGDGFGNSVSISGETVIVGASGDNDNGINSGSAYIFVRNGTIWTQQAKLLPLDVGIGRVFGRSVSISGETVVVGSTGVSENGSLAGAAYVFVRNGVTWGQQAKLLPNDGSMGDQFGRSVSISGETIVVGSFLDDDNGNDSGSAYIFVRNGMTWTQQAKLLPSDGAAEDFFGEAVHISGETVAVGVFRDDDNGQHSGSAYIFTRNGTVWTQLPKLLASDGAEHDQFGFSVSVENDVVAIGSRSGDGNQPDSGSGFVFDIFCQKDLGFQLGNLRLSICGQDLTKANSTATLCVSGAAPNAQIFLALGPTNNPMPLLGGFLVPFPFTALGPFPTDASGNFILSLSGGSNFPFMLFLQAAAFNGPVFELSNALEVNIGS